MKVSRVWLGEVDMSGYKQVDPAADNAAGEWSGQGMGYYRRPSLSVEFQTAARFDFLSTFQRGRPGRALA